MIVVEGPDGAGKTTLIKKLAEHWNLPIAPRVVGKDTKATVNIAEWVENNVSTGWQPILFDRHRLISEPIYGPLMRGVDQDIHFLDLEWVWKQLGQFYACQPIIIYCLPPLERVIDNVRNDASNDNSAVIDHVVPIYSAYVARAALDMSQRGGTTSIFDYTSSSHQFAKLFARWDRIIDARRHW